VTERHIVAMGGASMEADHPLFRFVAGLTGSAHPRVCYVPTGAGDSAWHVANFYRAFPARRFVPSHLALFERSVEDVGAFLLDQDAILVGGGNTANLLAVWRLHGVDGAMREAWTSGVVLFGASAGANCWFEGSTTDSFLLGRADPLPEGLGLLPGSFCPHYDSEPARRPSFRRLIADGVLPPGIACDDLVASHFVGTELAEVVTGKPGAGAYRVEPGPEGVVETSLPTRPAG
jgi:dipeptidase E